MFINEGMKFDVEWKNILLSLAYKFTMLVNKNLPNGSLNKLLSDTLQVIDSNDRVSDENSLVTPMLYYISGWLFTSIEKEGVRSG
mmetsp:Transcript_26495/g.52774  ORF Transcript_26495/g.52774 Transcript_26495/m.52774 type:complete len:85 (+) Transcript_26495:148-402(+)